MRIQGGVGVSASMLSGGVYLDIPVKRKSIKNDGFKCAILGVTRLPVRVIFFPTLVPGSGNFQLSRLAGLGYGLWVMVRVLGSDNHNRFPNSNPNLNHNSNCNLTLTPILTPKSS